MPHPHAREYPQPSPPRYTRQSGQTPQPRCPPRTAPPHRAKTPPLCPKRWPPPAPQAASNAPYRWQSSPDCPDQSPQSAPLYPPMNASQPMHKSANTAGPITRPAPPPIAAPPPASSTPPIMSPSSPNREWSPQTPEAGQVLRATTGSSPVPFRSRRAMSATASPARPLHWPAVPPTWMQALRSPGNTQKTAGVANASSPPARSAQNRQRSPPSLRPAPVPPPPTAPQSPPGSAARAPAGPAAPHDSHAPSRPRVSTSSTNRHGSQHRPQIRQLHRKAGHPKTTTAPNPAPPASSSATRPG